jgi:hypothetical protein
MLAKLLKDRAAHGMGPPDLFGGCRWQLRSFPSESTSFRANAVLDVIACAKIIGDVRKAAYPRLEVRGGPKTLVCYAVATSATCRDQNCQFHQDLTEPPSRRSHTPDPASPASKQ